jgi:hypothetical protein
MRAGRSSLVRRTMFVVVASMCAPSALHGQVITLTEAVRTAESNDRSIQIAELEREKAQREIGVARTHRYPIFSITALWEALCYAQIGGLTLATAVTLFLVPVFYAVCVIDLKVVEWTGHSAFKSVPEDDRT